MIIDVSFLSSLHHTHCTAGTVFILRLPLFLGGWCGYLSAGLSHNFCKKTSDVPAECLFLFPSLSCSNCEGTSVHKSENHIDCAWWHLSLVKVDLTTTSPFPSRGRACFPDSPGKAQDTQAGSFWIHARICHFSVFFLSWLLLDRFSQQHLVPMFSKQ